MLIQANNRQSLQTILFYLLGLFAGIWYVSFGVVHHTLFFIPGDFGDGRFNNYILEHGYRFFAGEDASFWNADFMFPESNVISYSDNLIGTVPFYSVFRLLGNDRETSFQLWFLLMSVFNYTAAFLFFRSLCGNSMAAVCGAFIFAFSISLQSQMAHAQTFPRFPVPLALWFTMAYQKDLSVRHFFLSLLMLVYQFYCGIYLGFMLAVPMALIFLFGIPGKKGLYRLRLRDNRWKLMIILAGIGAVLLLLPVMLPYIQRARSTGFYSYERVLSSLPTPSSYLFSRHGTLMWDMFSKTALSYPAFWDHQIFPGAVALMAPLLLIIFFMLSHFGKVNTVWNRLDAQRRLFFAAGLVTVIWFLNFYGFSFYRILFHFPGYGSMRALQRIINVNLLFFGGATSVIFAAIFSNAGRSRNIVFVITISMLIADNLVMPEATDKELKKVSQDRTESLINKIDSRNPDIILSYEPEQTTENIVFYHLDAMMAAQKLGIKTLNGYSATSPKGYSAYWIHPDESSRKKWLEFKKVEKINLQVVR